jgi:hypothetical protein
MCQNSRFRPPPDDFYTQHGRRAHSHGAESSAHSEPCIFFCSFGACFFAHGGGLRENEARRRAWTVEKGGAFSSEAFNFVFCILAVQKYIEATESFFGIVSQGKPTNVA